MLAPPRLGKDAFLLDLLIESLERCLETLIITDDNFGQPLSPPIKTTLRPHAETAQYPPRIVC